MCGDEERIFFFDGQSLDSCHFIGVAFDVERTSGDGRRTHPEAEQSVAATSEDFSCPSPSRFY